MLLVGIFGIETRDKNIRDISNTVCRGCGRYSSYRLIKTYNYFHFFFIPVFKWEIHYYVLSKCCGSMFELPRDIGIQLEGGRDVPIRNEDLKPADHSYYHSNNTCPFCRRNVASEFVFCPYCGTKVR